LQKIEWLGRAAQTRIKSAMHYVIAPAKSRAFLFAITGTRAAVPVFAGCYDRHDGTLSIGIAVVAGPDARASGSRADAVTASRSGFVPAAVVPPAMSCRQEFTAQARPLM
jgi:hypothetical protein